MTSQLHNVNVFKANPYLFIFALIIIIGIVLYYLYIAIDSSGLPEQKGTAKIIAKEYKPPGQTYSRQVIGGRVHTLPMVTNEMYILHVNLNSQTTFCAVTKDIYDTLNVGDQIQVSYKQRRIKGTLQIIKVVK